MSLADPNQEEGDTSHLFEIIHSETQHNVCPGLLFDRRPLIGPIDGFTFITAETPLFERHFPFNCTKVH